MFARDTYAVPITTPEYTEASEPAVYRLFAPGVSAVQPQTKLLFSRDDAPMVSDGIFGFPLANWVTVTDRFGVERGENHTHGGIDLAVFNEIIFSTCKGTVIVSTFSELPTSEGYGNYVIIRCDEKDWSMVFAHLSRVAVEVGQDVERGQPIGISGSTGFSTGEHLHFEIRYKGMPIDPEFYLDFGAPPRENPANGELEACPDPNVVPDPDATPTTKPIGCPEPSVTPTPTPSATPSPTATTTPTPTVASTPTPSATPTVPSPTATPTVPVTEEPSPTESPTETETETTTPEATTETPEVTATSVPEETATGEAGSTWTPEIGNPALAPIYE